MSIFAAASAVLLAAAAQSPAQPPHPLLDAAIRCRAETNDQARLRCYDSAVEAVQQSLERGSLVAVEREEAQRSLFGLSMPRFLRGPGDDDGPRELETTVRSAAHTGYRMWVLDLEEGGTWRTIENSSRQELPRPGDRVRLTRAQPLGNYWLSVNGGMRLRVTRVN